MKTDPLPWTYELTDSMDDDDDAFVIQSPEGYVAEICSLAIEAEGNAALIVRAVNQIRDRELVLAAIISGRARWEPFTGDSLRGELCFDGMRYATELDEFGCPVVNDLIRERLGG